MKGRHSSSHGRGKVSERRVHLSIRSIYDTKKKKKKICLERCTSFWSLSIVLFAESVLPSVLQHLIIINVQSHNISRAEMRQFAEWKHSCSDPLTSSQASLIISHRFTAQKNKPEWYKNTELMRLMKLISLTSDMLDTSSFFFFFF